MKRVRYIFLIIISIIIFIPNNLFALTEDEFRKVIVDYAYYTYNNKKNTISYAKPGTVNFSAITQAHYSANNTFGVDCSAFVSFVVYNALHTNNLSDVFDRCGTVALNGVDGWSSHSKYYDSKMYSLGQKETIQSAVHRHNIQSLLKPGDLIGVLGYVDSSYKNYDESDKWAHIMIYVGNGKYIHNRGSGLAIGSLSNISHANKVGSTFEGGTHGSITILKPKNYSSLPSSIIGKIRYPDGYGNYKYYNLDGSLFGENDGSLGVENSSFSGGENISSGNSSIGNGYVISHNYRDEFKKIVYIVGIILMIITIVVPILLVVMASIDLVKSMTQTDKIEMKRIIISILTKVVSAVVIFLLPSLISLIIELINYNAEWNEYADCVSNPLSCNVNLWDNNRNGSSSIENSDNTIKNNLIKYGTYISLTSNENVSGYYFSKTKETLSGNESKWIKSNKKNIDFVLLPGNYYIYTKALSGKVIENFVQVLDSDIVDTKRVNDIKSLSIPFNTFLLSNGSSIEEFNNMIYRSVTIAGVNTREGVAAASLAFTQSLYKKWKIKIPYGFNAWATFGANPNWGNKTTNQNAIDKGYDYVGIHCGGFVAWSFSNANYKVNSGIGSSRQLYCWKYATASRVSSNNFGNIGDAVTLLETSYVENSCADDGKSSHVGVISYKTSNGFWVTESDTVGVVTTFENAGNTRWKTILDMKKTYDKNKKIVSRMTTGF